MKKIFTSIFLLLAMVSQSQVTFNSLILNAKRSELPYNSDSGVNENNNVRILNDQQKQYVLTKLKSIEPLLLFEKKYSKIESPDCKNCLDFGEKDEIHLNTYVKWGNDFLVLLTLNQGERKRGVLASVDSKGEWISWFISEASVWIDDKFGLLRNIDIGEGGNININENYFEGEKETHSHVAMLITGRTSDGKYIPFGKFHITTRTSTQ